jgi:hypothetical protein
MCCLDKSVTDCQCKLRKFPEERRFQRCLFCLPNNRPHGQKLTRAPATLTFLDNNGNMYDVKCVEIFI